MKVRALRGVCIGVERHLVPGDVEVLEPQLASYLTSIGAVEEVVDEPAPVAETEDLTQVVDATDPPKFFGRKKEK
jgi:hypothetical protein